MAILLGRKQHRWNRCAALEADYKPTYSHCTKTAARSRNWRDPQRSWCHQTSCEAYHHHPTVKPPDLLSYRCWEKLLLDFPRTSIAILRAKKEILFQSNVNCGFWGFWYAFAQHFGYFRGYVRTPKWPNDDALDAELPGRPLEGQQIMTRNATQQAPSLLRWNSPFANG